MGYRRRRRADGSVRVPVEARRLKLWRAQNGLCSLCGTPLDYEEAHLDHDHDCCDMPVAQACGLCDRGVLHGTCNTLLGFAYDDQDLLLKAIAYLKRTDILPKD